MKSSEKLVESKKKQKLCSSKHIVRRIAITITEEKMNGIIRNFSDFPDRISITIFYRLGSYFLIKAFASRFP